MADPNLSRFHGLEVAGGLTQSDVLVVKLHQPNRQENRLSHTLHREPQDDSWWDDKPRSCGGTWHGPALCSRRWGGEGRLQLGVLRGELGVAIWGLGFREVRSSVESSCWRVGFWALPNSQ